ncbi:MAG: hypothetical protein ACJ71Z_06910 [Aeromicrobium sp.]
MPVAVLYPLALLGALTVVAFGGLLLLMLLGRVGSHRASHRKVRNDGP